MCSHGDSIPADSPLTKGTRAAGREGACRTLLGTPLNFCLIQVTEDPTLFIRSLTHSIYFPSIYFVLNTTTCSLSSEILSSS